jgi:hypothetical protein
MERGKEHLMRIVIAMASLLGALTLSASAWAVPPIHDTFTVHRTVTHTEPCGFPVVQDWDFTNDITAFLDAEGNSIALHLHQSSVGTLTGKGTTLRLNIRETIFVYFEDGVEVRAKHVGVLDSIIGPGGPVFLRTGQTAFEVVFDPDRGFYVDGPLLARHGLRADFDPVAFCAAFS